MRTVRKLRRVLAAVGVGAVTVVTAWSGAAPGWADPPATAGSSGTGGFDALGDPPTRPLCPEPEPGFTRCLSEVRTDIAMATGDLGPADDPAGYGADDLQDAYGLPSGTAGVGGTVAIVVAYDYPNAEADLAVYRERFGLPACTSEDGCFQKVDQRGGTDYPRYDPFWAGEAALDLDMVSATCPNCHILLVEGDDPSPENLGTAVDTAVELGADVVSNSYGLPAEVPVQTEYDHFYDHPGVAITVSSGDAGYGASWPASSPYVTSVGGTSMLPTGDGRGWSERAWSGAGSGCSTYEPKPDFQTDTGCDNRTIADVSAVADPATGVAVYDSNLNGGWKVYGGTSASAPIIAGVYALAGPAGPGEYPNSYPYASSDGLWDVVGGSNGSCSAAYLCEGVEGYDGPTGLGTPNGVAAFRRPVERGELTGTVSGGGQPLAGVTVTAGGLAALTDSDGQYDLAAEPGTYQVTASAFGYETGTVTDVVVTAGQTSTVDIDLTRVPMTTIAGTVTDDSGHGWPLHAKVSADGVDTNPVWTDPETGRYEITLPTGADYTLLVDADLPGYPEVSESVTLGPSNLTLDFPMPVDERGCAAPGYTVNTVGSTESFDATTAPDGWTVTDNSGSGGVWVFDNPGRRANRTGADGGFAIADNENFGVSGTQDTTLISPPVDMTDMTSPRLRFGTDYMPFQNGSTAEVDYSVDGGQTWTNIWHHDTDAVNFSNELLELPGAAGQPDVRVRFHYVALGTWWWQVDDVFIGNRTCDPVPGGLVVGRVTDRNTGAPLDHATVTSADDPDQSATTATTRDPAFGAGYYLLFSSAGQRSFSTAHGRYQDATRSVSVLADSAVRSDVSLGAGHLLVSVDQISADQMMGTATSHQVEFTNDGSAPVEVTLSGRNRGLAEPMAHTPTRRVSGTFSPNQLTTQAGVAEPDATEPPWVELPDYPSTMMDMAMTTASDGRVYSIGGARGNGPVTSAYSYDPATRFWRRIADSPRPREGAVATEYQGEIYVFGGWNEFGDGQSATDVYDPVTDSWSSATPHPNAMAGSGAGRVGDTMYMVGGCMGGCGHVEAYAFDLASTAWTRIADYPEATSWTACGGIAGTLYCAGGLGRTASAHTYAYHPGSNSWERRADLPTDLWGSAFAAVGGRLIVSSGVTEQSAVTTNEGYAYDPATNQWTTIPNGATALYRAGSACGFFKVGGSASDLFHLLSSSERLPGLGDCGSGGGGTDWISADPGTFTVEPGQTVSATVILDATDPEVVDQPGGYSGQLAVVTDSPYVVPLVAVTMTVDPPPTWGKITGTVTGRDCHGATGSIAGATVQIDTWVRSYTLFTDADGHFQLWLDWRHSPVTMIVGRNGWQPTFRMLSVSAGDTTTANVTLRPDCR